MGCTQDECSVGESGRCMEDQLPPQNCPHYLEDSSAVISTQTDENEGANEDDQASRNAAIETDDRVTQEYDPDHDTPLPSGKALSVLEANALARERKIRLVAFVGPTDAGKTSLFSALYDRFQFGSYGGFDFAGTNTLIGFEERCHDTRFASKLSEPVHPHTRRSGVAEFLHLCVKSHDSGNRMIDFLFTDRSGEEFERAIKNTDRIGDLNEIERADYVVILVDGAKFSDKTLTHRTQTDTIRMLQALVDNGALGLDDNVDIVLSKLDEIETSDRRGEIEEEFERFRENIFRG